MIEVVKNTAAGDALLAEVLEQYLEAVEAGAAPARAELLAQHPQVAEQLEACLSSLDFIRRAGTSRGAGGSPAREGDTRDGQTGGPPAPRHESGLAGGPPAPRSPAEAPTPRPASETPLPGRQLPADVLAGAQVQLGDYRILREIGRGGMGIVYEAAEQSSGRRVALKILPFAAALDPRQLLRFKNEAQAAAQLQHPHIVPIFAVGSVGEVHYYAMKFIAGRTLAQRIADCRLQIADMPTAGTATAKSAICNLQSAVTDVASFGIQAAEALEEAHRAGIIHRDIKPANLLVEESGHLWVVDFGLARFQHDAGALTLTGDVVGTLRYMSPEQALGKHGIVDQRADVYSLGVTLYELATLRPAFDGSDRQELLRKIIQDEPCPPRRLNEDIPVALETILFKACAKNPVRRYTTARELADDLKRFLAGQAIVATRPGLIERAGRWARRHKAVVASAAAVLLLALVSLAVSSFFILRARSESERRAEEARRAADDFYTQVAQRWWYQQPYMEEVQREFLLKALAFYKKFSAERGGSRNLRLEAAKAARRVADIQQHLGDRDKAETAYEAAIGRLKELTDEDAGEPVCRDELARAHSHHGNLLREERRFAEAETAYRSAHELFAALVAENPQPDYREGLAGSLYNLGAVLASQGQPVGADKAYRQALTVLVALTDEQPRTPAYQRALAGCRTNLAALLRDTNRPGEALAVYDQAIASWKQLSAQMPGVPVFRQDWAASLSGLGVVHAALGRSRDAENVYRQALALRERLAAEYPGVPAYGQALAASQHSLGRLLAGEGHVEEARILYSQALAVRQDLARRMPALSSYRQELADTYQSLASLLADMRQPRAAERALVEAVVLRTELANKESNRDSEWDLAQSQHAYGTVLCSLGRFQEAENLYRQAIARLEKLGAALAAPSYRLELATARNDLGLLYQRTARFPEAEKVQRSALTERDRLAAEMRGAPYYRLEVARGQFSLGSLFQDTGRGPEADAGYRRAIAIAQKLTKDFPAQREYRWLLSVACDRLAELLIVTEKLTEAEQALKQAHPLLGRLRTEHRTLPAYREEWARHQHALGVLLMRTSRSAAAQAAFREELTVREKLAAEFVQDPGLLRDLSCLLANCPEVKLRQPRRAVELAKQALAKNPNNAPTLAVLGLSHYRNGNWKEAIAALEQAEELPGRHEGGRFILAMAEWQLGNKQKAHGWFRQARVKQYRPLDDDLRSLAAEAKRTLEHAEAALISLD